MGKPEGQSSVRVGILGAARIGKAGVIRPSRSISGVEVVAVASRSEDRARAYAQEHDLPKWFGSYDDLLNDPEIDAIYLALPPALHAKWSMLAMERGKHVLCEKPLAENADQASAMLETARAKNVILTEGMHFHFLEILQKQREIVRSGELGAVTSIRSDCTARWVSMEKDDFRLSFELGGGAALDLGCYAAFMLCFMVDEEPTVTSARHRLISPNVDRWMSAELDLGAGARGSIHCCFRGFVRSRLGLTIVLEKGSTRWGRKGLVCKSAGRTRIIPAKFGSTLVRQLEAFVMAVQGDDTAILPPEESVRTMRVIDAMYEKSGLARRGSWRESSRDS